MSLSNNDYNHRLVAAVDIPENTAVTIDGSGRAAIATTQAATWGICPQVCKAGTRVPAIRGGTLSGLIGFTAGTRLRVQSDGSLGTGGSGTPIAIVKAEDSSTALLNSSQMGAGIT